MTSESARAVKRRGWPGATALRASGVPARSIVTDADLVDAGMIFGTGFAPFRGGPLHYARARGVSSIVARLEELAAKHGPRFKPDAGWAAFKAGR